MTINMPLILCFLWEFCRLSYYTSVGTKNHQYFSNFWSQLMQHCTNSFVIQFIFNAAKEIFINMSKNIILRKRNICNEESFKSNPPQLPSLWTRINCTVFRLNWRTLHFTRLSSCSIQVEFWNSEGLCTDQKDTNFSILQSLRSFYSRQMLKKSG